MYWSIVIDFDKFGNKWIVWLFKIFIVLIFLSIFKKCFYVYDVGFIYLIFGMYM